MLMAAIDFVPSLPRTETGKLQRFALRKLAMDEAGKTNATMASAAPAAGGADNRKAS